MDREPAYRTFPAWLDLGRTEMEIAEQMELLCRPQAAPEGVVQPSSIHESQRVGVGGIHEAGNGPQTNRCFAVRACHPGRKGC